MKLRNQEIYLAYTNLVKLAESKLPVKVSLGVAVLISKLKQPYWVIETERQKLVKKYGKLDLATKQVSVSMDSEEAGDFAREYGELLTLVWEEDLTFNKVLLPQTIVTTCEGCGHKVETPLLVDANMLLPLRAHFIDVA